MWLRLSFQIIIYICVLIAAGASVALAQTSSYVKWKQEYPRTDFNNACIPLYEIIEGGLKRGEINALESPKFIAATDILDLGPMEPVVSVDIDGDIRAYPIRILMYHQVINDIVSGVPVLVTYDPLSNAAIVYERTIETTVLHFEATGRIRKSNMLMFDRETETWWQQFTGRAIVGDHNEKILKTVPARIESFALFKERSLTGRVHVPDDPRGQNYGMNPYISYDSEDWPFLYSGIYEEEIEPLSRVVVIADQAWPLSLIKTGDINYDGLIIKWEAGQNSPLDTPRIYEGKDVGNVSVTRDGTDVSYHVPFAFTYRAFYPDGTIHTE